MQQEPRIEQYWNEFLTKTNRNTDLQYYECFYFGHTEQLANELLDLVLKDVKKATASSLWCYEAEGEKIPEVGDLSIVTDWDGNPKCVIETTAVTIIPFKDMTYDVCKREGEDENLESWQNGHIKFFTQEAKESGYEFSWEMPVVFEDFVVIYK